MSPQTIYNMSQPPSLFELAEQPVVCSERKVQGAGLVVRGIGLEVLDDVCEEVSPLYPTAWRLVAQFGEVDVEVVVGRLVVQVNSKFTGRDVVAL